jgi:DNA-binding MarR family transcriptional regulator
MPGATSALGDYPGQVSAIEIGSEQVDYLTLDHQVCFSLAVASRTVISLYKPLLEPLGLTHPQYLVMVALWESEPLSVKEISALLQLESPSVSPVLKRLQAAGLIERQRDAADERTVRLSLTPRGRSMKEQARDIPSAIFDQLGMTLEELQSLQDQLNRLIRYTHHAEPTVVDETFGVGEA